MVEKLSHTLKQAEEILGDVKLYPPDQVITDDTEIEIGGEKKLLHTPGHIPVKFQSIIHPQKRYSQETPYMRECL